MDLYPLLIDCAKNEGFPLAGALDLDRAFAVAGITDWEEFVSEDPQFKRPAEVDTLLGDATKAKKILDWEPTVTFDELVEMMVESDLRRVKTYGPRIEDFREW